MGVTAKGGSRKLAMLWHLGQQSPILMRYNNSLVTLSADLELLIRRSPSMLR
jgi:hypothetical protein